MESHLIPLHQLAEKVKIVKDKLSSLSKKEGLNRYDVLATHRLEHCYSHLNGLDLKITTPRDVNTVKSVHTSCHAKRRCHSRHCNSGACKECIKIPFTLGNGLPQSNPEAIPNCVNNKTRTYGTLVIDAPGYYVLQNSPQMQLNGGTLEAPSIAIIIKSSNVYIDLCHNVISGSGNLTAPFSPQPSVPEGIRNDTRVDVSVGISVNPDFSKLDSITIANGTLEFFSLNGVTHQNVDNFTVDHVEFRVCGSLTLKDTSAAIHGLFGDNILVNECRFTDNMHGDHTCLFHKNFKVQSCVSRGLVGGAVTEFQEDWLALPEYVQYGIFAAPLGINFCDNVLIDNYLSSHIRAAAVVYGIALIYGGVGATVRNSHSADAVQNLRDTTIFNGPMTFGVEIFGLGFGTTTGVLVENCSIQRLGAEIQLIDSVSVYPFTGNSCTAFNAESCSGVVFRDCLAEEIYTSGKITATQPNRLSRSLVDEMVATGFQMQASATEFGNNVTFVNCVASNVNGGRNASQDMKSEGIGYSIHVGFGDQPFISRPTILLVDSCAAYNCAGSSTSSGFGYQSPMYFPFQSNFINCTSQFDKFRNADFSNGFYLGGYVNSVTLKNCSATCHTLDGFYISGYTGNSFTGSTSAILDGCIANSNSGKGFNFDQNSKKVEVINCKATSNGQDGFQVEGRDIVLRSNVSDLNIGSGFHFDGYFAFKAKVATDTDLQNLDIYAGGELSGYTLVYDPSLVGMGYNTYILQLIPNDPNAPLPEFLPINGVEVRSGDIVLVKDETTGTLNGVYQAKNTGASGGIVLDTFNYFGNNFIAPPVNVTNPAPDVVNPSSYVLEFIKSAGAEVWAGAYARPNAIIDLVSATSITIQVLMDHIGTLTLQLESSFPISSPNWSQTQSNTLINQWETLTFDVTQGSSGDISNIAAGKSWKTIVLFADFGVSPTQDIISYYDNIVVNPSGQVLYNFESGTYPPVVPNWQLIRLDPWRFPFTVLADTKVLVELSNLPNLTPGPVVYSLLNDTAVDIDVPTFSASQSIVPGVSHIVADDCKAALNSLFGFHNSAIDVVVRDSIADRNTRIGFVDDSTNGAKQNGNIYAKNRAIRNTNVVNDYSSNFLIDYVTPSEPSILLHNSLSLNKFPQSDSFTPEANTSISL